MTCALYSSKLLAPLTIRYRSLKSITSGTERRKLAHENNQYIQLIYTVEYQYLTGAEYDTLYSIYGNLTSQYVNQITSGNFNLIFHEYCTNLACTEYRAEVYTEPVFDGPYTNQTDTSSQSDSHSSYRTISSWLFIVIPIGLCVILSIVLFCIYQYRQSEKVEHELATWVNSNSKHGDIRIYSPSFRYSEYFAGASSQFVNSKIPDSVYLDFVYSTDEKVNSDIDITSDKVRHNLKNFQSKLVDLRSNSSMLLNSGNSDSPNVYPPKNSF